MNFKLLARSLSIFFIATLMVLLSGCPTKREASNKANLNTANSGAISNGTRGAATGSSVGRQMEQDRQHERRTN